MSAPELFSWLNPDARYLPGAQHAENTFDAAGGIALILGMVEASDLAAETEGKANLAANDRAMLIRLAMASARMLRDEARQHIDWLNTHGAAQAVRA